MRTNISRKAIVGGIVEHSISLPLLYYLSTFLSREVKGRKKEGGKKEGGEGEEGGEK